MRPYRQLYPWHSSSAKCTQPPSSKAGTSRHTGPWSSDGWEWPLKLIHCDPPAVSRDISSYIRLLRVLSNLTLNIPEAALRLAKESSEAGWRLVKSAVHTIFLGAFFFPLWECRCWQSEQGSKTWLHSIMLHSPCNWYLQLWHNKRPWTVLQVHSSSTILFKDLNTGIKMLQCMCAIWKGKKKAFT